MGAEGTCTNRMCFGDCAQCAHWRDLNDAYEKGLREAVEWIPITEALPSDRATVLVTAYWHETYQVMLGSYYGDDLWWCVPFNNWGEHMQRITPKAWMPLINPYKGINL